MKRVRLDDVYCGRPLLIDKKMYGTLKNITPKQDKTRWVNKPI